MKKFSKIMKEIVLLLFLLTFLTWLYTYLYDYRYITHNSFSTSFQQLISYLRISLPIISLLLMLLLLTLRNAKFKHLNATLSLSLFALFLINFALFKYASYEYVDSQIYEISEKYQRDGHFYVELTTKNTSVVAQCRKETYCLLMDQHSYLITLRGNTLLNHWPPIVLELPQKLSYTTPDKEKGVAK